mgnify:CR=1 FL=1
MSTDISKFRLLLVDDSDFSRAKLRTLLTQNGFNVVGEASNGNEAMRLVKEKKPHLVLMDVVMPEMSGIELTEKIVQTYTTVGVIVVSSLTQEQVVMQAIAAGAADFIAKPLDPVQLIESVTQYLTSAARD